MEEHALWNEYSYRFCNWQNLKHYWTANIENYFLKTGIREEIWWIRYLDSTSQIHKFIKKKKNLKNIKYILEIAILKKKHYINNN